MTALGLRSRWQGPLLARTVDQDGFGRKAGVVRANFIARNCVRVGSVWGSARFGATAKDGGESGCGGGSSGWGARSVPLLLVIRVLSAATLLDEVDVLLDFGLGRH